MKSFLMYLILATFLLNAISHVSASEGFYCRSVYENKMKKMKKNKVIRKIGIGAASYAIGVSSGVAVGLGAAAIGAGGLAARLIVYSPFYGIGLGLSVYRFLDHEPEIIMARDFLTLLADKNYRESFMYSGLLGYIIKGIYKKVGTKTEKIKDLRIKEWYESNYENIKSYIKGEAYNTDLSISQSRETFSQLYEILKEYNTTDKFCQNNRYRTLKQITRLNLIKNI